MSQNDMQVIACKILLYLQECLKAGKRPDLTQIQYCSGFLNIPKSYWQTVVQELCAKGYVAGLACVPTKDGLVFSDIDMHITLDGAEYLEENGGMQQAKHFLGQAFLVTLEGIVAGLTTKI